VTVPASRVCRLVDEAPEPLWARLADFPNWRTWLDRVRDSRMAPGPTHSPGAVRVVGPPDNPRVHEVMLAIDAPNYTLTYAVATEPVWAVAARNYVATVRLVPLTDRPATVVDWSSRYDCDQADEGKIGELFVELYSEFIVNLTSLISDD
jgi:hypothetical protein